MPVSNLAHSQYLLWLGQRLHPDAPLYNMVLAFRIRGPIDPVHFERAFQAVLDRSDALRTVIEEREGAPAQMVRDPYPHALELVDLSGERDPESALRAWIRQRAVRLFDLREELFDTALLRLGRDSYIWYLNQHHLVTDAWSTALVYRTVSELYQSSVQGTLPGFPSLPPYVDYVRYEHALRSTPRFARAREHWTERGSGPLAPLRLYGKRADRETTAAERITRELGRERSTRLRALAASAGAGALTMNLSLFNVFATTLLAYLHRVSGERRLVFGTPSHGRQTAAFRKTIGAFIEIFPFSVEVEEAETWESLFAKVQAESSAFLRHAQPGTSTAEANRKVNVILNYIHADFPAFAGLPMQSEWVHAGHCDANHHLRLQVHDFDASGRFLLHFDFNAALFDATERERAADHFLRILDAQLDDPRRGIHEVDLLGQDEKNQLLHEFNVDSRPSPGGTVVDLFRAQLARTPDAPAAVQDDRALTYLELSRRADLLAHHLGTQGVGRGALVGLHLERSLESVVGILAVLRAGAAYLPLSPTDPEERISQLLRDAAPRLVLTRASLRHLLPPEVQSLCVDELISPSAPEASLEAAAPTEDDAAYVLYTSGSTGRPKGVVVDHRALTGYLVWARDRYCGKRPTDFPLFTSLSFDLTVTSLFLPLITGGRVRVYAEEEGGVPALLRVLTDDSVDAVKLTPSHLALIPGMDLRESRVRTLILGGEDLKTEVARAASDAFGDVVIYNEYGPTEATVGCMIHRFDRARDTETSVPIGRAAGQARVYLLDRHLHPVPCGVPGEIFVAGTGVARGYLNRPDLTDERFLPDPFHPGERMYRTGDLGRWRPTGVMEYLGRYDQQVKVAGIRMEPGEIEAALLEHPTVHACVVEVRSEAPEQQDGLSHCARCGLPSNYPGARYDAEGICHLCQGFEQYREKAQRYFRTMDELRSLLARARERRRGSHDCLLLLSGGKDSTYALYRLVALGASVLTFTLDNGYISQEAKANIRRVTESLGVEHVFGTTPAMNAIFVDSLKRHAAVCNGCFKTIYTLGTRLARERGIPMVVTGLSRGQFFETRLTEELFWSEAVDVERIDRMILEARKAYHRADDAVARLLQPVEFQNDSLFEEIEFVDFYRYCDVGLDEMLAYLAEHAPWIRPSDTGRSTNCLINVVGIAVHKRERGYHNYAFPYSWDVRMGHKTRDAALDELEESIDPRSVQRILHEIGYEEGLRPTSREARLVAYYAASTPVTPGELRAHLARRLPAYMIPSRFVPLDTLPLTPHGKVDRAALPPPEPDHSERPADFVPPRGPVEERIVAIWAEVLGTSPVGVTDRFLDLGGSSLLAIRIITRVNELFGVQLPLQSAFEASTVAALSKLVEETLLAEIGSLSEEEAERLAREGRG